MASIMESRDDTCVTVSITSFFETWLREMERQVSPSTFKSYSAIIRQFLCHAGSEASKEIAGSNPDLSDISSNQNQKTY
jgi:hypothetical protein